MSVVEAGNIARARVHFKPRAGYGPVALADVTAAIISPVEEAANLTVVQTGVNRFIADHPIPDNADDRAWDVEWNSNAPSPQIRKVTRFHVKALP